MKFDLDEVEALAHDTHKLIDLLYFYCKQNDVEEFVEDIMPLVKVIYKKSDDLYCRVLSARHPDMFDS